MKVTGFVTFRRLHLVIKLQCLTQLLESSSFLQIDSKMMNTNDNRCSFHPKRNFNLTKLWVVYETPI